MKTSGQRSGFQVESLQELIVIYSCLFGRDTFYQWSEFDSTVDMFNTCFAENSTSQTKDQQKQTQSKQCK